MKAQLAHVGAKGIDSEPFSHNADQVHAERLKASGVEFVLSYLGAIKPEQLAHILEAGLAFMPCTYADKFDGPTAVSQLKTLGIPAKTTVWLDIEGEGIIPPKMDAQTLILKINAWADTIKKAGYEPGLYVGSPQPLTGDELYRLKVVRYWKAPSKVLDRNGKDWSGPGCGWCMYQLWDSVMHEGVWVDFDFIHKDHLGRLPTWVVG